MRDKEPGDYYRCFLDSRDSQQIYFNFFDYFYIIIIPCFFIIVFLEHRLF